jgi:hypothetical protein
MMEPKKMKTAELEEALRAADDEHWHYRELLDMRLEDQAEDLATLHYDSGVYDKEIEAFEKKAIAAEDQHDELLAEKVRRFNLSNHARLIEEAARGEVIA